MRTSMPEDRGQTADRLRDYHRRCHLRDHCAARPGVLGVHGRGQIHRRYRCVLDLVLQIHVRAAGAARQTAPPSCVGMMAGSVANSAVQAGAQPPLAARTWAPRCR